jgi:hypothetical protein
MGVKMKLTLDSVRNSPQHMILEDFAFGPIPREVLIKSLKHDGVFEAVALAFVVSVIEGLTESENSEMFWDVKDDTDQKWMVRPLKHWDGIDFLPYTYKDEPYEKAEIWKEHMLDNLDSIAGCIVLDLRDLPSATIGIIDVAELKRRQFVNITPEEAVDFGFEKAPS